MKEGWEYKKLGEVCQKTINIKWDEHPNHQYKYIDLSAVDRMTHKVMSTTSICSIDAPSRAKQIVNEGDVLFATTRPTLKRLVIIDKSLDGQICSTGFCVLRPTPAAIMSSWLYYALSNQSFYNYIEPLQKGASYPAVTDNQVKSYKIPVPPLSEQQRIVSYLDAAFAKIDAVAKNAEDSLNEAKALFQSALTKMMEPKEGWEYKKLGEVATFRRGLTYSKKDECNHSTNIVLRSNNIDLDSGKLCFDKLKYLKEDFFISNDKKVKRGCLLMCMSNGSKAHLGKVALIDRDYGYAFGGFMSMVVPSSIIFGDYLFYNLGTPQYKAFIKSLSAGANINNIKVRDLEKFSIPVPPLSEQRHIVSYLDVFKSKVDQLQSNLTRTLTECAALKQAILRQTFE